MTPDPPTGRTRTGGSAVTDPTAREFLRQADPILGKLIDALDRPDVLLAGDLALRRAVQHAYKLDHLPTEDEMLGTAEPWRPYRSLAVSYLFAYELDSGA